MTKIYIDAANIILSGREIGFEIDFQKLKIYLDDVYRAYIIYFFTANLQSQKDFYKELEDIGFKIISCLEMAIFLCFLITVWRIQLRLFYYPQIRNLVLKC